MIIFKKSDYSVISSCNSSFCDNCLIKHNEKFHKYYQSIVDDSDADIHICPFGYCSIVGANKIYSGLRIKKFYNPKKVDSDYRNGYTSSTIMTKEEVYQLINELDMLDKKVETHKTYVSTIHDIKRATSCFVDLLEEVIDDGNYKNDQKLRDLIDGLDYIRTRLDYHDFSLNKTQDIAKSKNKIYLVDIGYKISKMLKYKSDMRNKKIVNSNNASQSIFIINDSKSIFVLFFILLENAIKYSPNNSTIFVDYFLLSHNQVMVRFKNSIKTPLSKDDLNNIFKSGYRGSNSKDIPGSGQGMSIVKSILDDCDASYSASMDDNNHTFVFEITFI